MPANSMYDTTHQHHVMYFLASCGFNLYWNVYPNIGKMFNLTPAFNISQQSLNHQFRFSQTCVTEGEHLGSFTPRAAWFTQCCVRWTEATSAWATASHRTFPGWGEWGVIGRVWRLRDMDFGMGKVDFENVFLVDFRCSSSSMWLSTTFWMFQELPLEFTMFFSEFHILLPQLSQKKFRSSAVRPRVLHDCLWHKQRNQRRQLPSRF